MKSLRIERLKYDKHRKKAIASRIVIDQWHNACKEDPHNLVTFMPQKLHYTIIIDIMDQSKGNLIHFSRKAKTLSKDIEFKVRLSGGILQGHMIDGLFDFAQHKKGIDINASQLIELLWKLQKKYAPLPIFGKHAVLYIQADNASDNKNHVMLSLMAMLAETGLFGKVKLNYLKPGTYLRKVSIYIFSSSLLYW
jgi:ADP-heptose:LPS heptosyltransferase